MPVATRSGSAGFAPWRASPPVALILIWFVFGAALASASPDDTAPMSEVTDFEALVRPGSPNSWLVAPASSPPTLRTDAVADKFDVSAPRLSELWRAMVQEQTRSRVTAVSGDGLQVEAEQRSALFRFVDRVSFRAIPLGEDRSTFIAYSRSQLGYWDLGVNRGRLTDWIEALRRSVGQSVTPGARSDRRAPD
jgi:uncharacterized protein (DUF1499 family)